MNAVLSNGEPPVCEAVKNASKDVLSVLIKGKYRGVIIQYYSESITPSAYYVPIVGGARALAYDLGSLSIPNLYVSNECCNCTVSKQKICARPDGYTVYILQRDFAKPACCRTESNGRLRGVAGLLGI